MGSEIRLVAVAAVVMVTLIRMTSSQIFTSSLKVERMVREEDKLLMELKRFIDYQFMRLKHMSNFYVDRFRDVNFRHSSNFDLSHPNAVFKAIKRFAADYSSLLGDQFGQFRTSAEKSMRAYVADNSDVTGAMLSLLRLQNVYNLRALDMANGNYKHYQGPQLQSMDAYEIGQIAFSGGQINQSIDWLNASLAMYTKESLNKNYFKVSGPSLGAIKALLGRAYLLNANREIAEELYKEATELDPHHPDVSELMEGLQAFWPKFEPPELPQYFHNFSRLCSLEGRYDPLVPVSPLAVCRYRQVVLPYYRFQEEIISVSPFVTLFYSVISDAEGDHIKGFVKNNLVRGKVGSTKSIVSEVRTSDLAWIYDRESPTVASISRRIGRLTGLDTDQRVPGGPSSGEASQVVNYGLGGHYEVHMDPLDNASTNTDLKFSGERIATFLLYLSDVEKGGSTVFTQAGISVAPVKNMALMWYNFNPALQLDERTHHAGCPVLIGAKWIVNKWIWTYGNTFRRRCGLRPDVTQLDIEDDMRNSYK